MAGVIISEDDLNEVESGKFRQATQPMLASLTNEMAKAEQGFRGLLDQAGQTVSSTFDQAGQAVQQTAATGLGALDEWTKDWSPPKPAAQPAQPDTSGVPPIDAFTSRWLTPPTPSGTPAGMPTAPGLVPATITSGPKPGQTLRPGESVGSVTLGDGGKIDNSSRESFVRTAFPHMLKAAGGDRNLAEMMLAKAISENGDVGKGGDFVGNNFSGIKGAGSAGSFRARTWEQGPNGDRVEQDADFAAYNTPEEGMHAFMSFLRENPRYAPALERYQQTGDAEELFQNINRAGYATDTNWGSTIASIRRDQVAPALAAIPGPDQSPNGTPITAPQAARGSERPSQFAEGLSWDEAIAACGLAGVSWFTAKTGRTPATVAEVKQAAEVSKAWDQDKGMYGIEATARLMREKYNIPAIVVEGVDFERVRRDVLSGNPVMFDTDAGSNGHYYTVGDARQRADGQWEYDLGTSATDLKASGGKRWYTEAEIPGLGFGRPYKTVYMDNPTTPTPSPAVSAANPNAGAPSPSGPAPAAAGGPPPASGSPGNAMWSPDGPVEQQGAFQASAGRSGGQGMMMRAPLDDEYIDPDSGPREATHGSVGASPVQPYGPPLSEAGPEMPTSYNDPTDGGTIQTPIPPPPAPSYTLVDGRTAPPTANGDYLPTRTIPSPQYADIPPPDQTAQGTPTQYQPQSYGPFVSETTEPELTPPGSPYAVGQAESMEPAPNRFDERPGYGQVVASAGEPDYVDSRPQTVTQAIGQGIRSQQGPGGLLEPTGGTARATMRMNEIGRIAAAETGRPLGLLAIQDPAWRAQNPELVAEYEDLQRQFDMGMLGNLDAPSRVAQPIAQAVSTAVGKWQVVDRAGALLHEAMSQADALSWARANARGAAILPPAQIDQAATAAVDAGRTVREAAEGVASRARGLVDDAVEAAAPVVREAAQGARGLIDEAIEGTTRFVADSGPTPRSRMNMEDVAQRAQEVMGVKPEEVKRWQSETLAEPAYGRAVRGSALQQAASIDEDAAMRAIERLERAQAVAASAGGDIERLSAIDRMELADAALEAAEAALAMQGSRAASTAEGRATARALAQRRQAITARTAVESAERARQVGQDAAFAAREAQRAAKTGRVSAQAESKLRTIMDKLNEPEKHGLLDDGAGGRLEALEQRAEAARTAAQTPAAPRTEAPVTGMRSDASRYTAGLGTQIASEVGTILGGTGIGAGIGAAANPDDPLTGARYGAVAGAVTAFGGRRLAPRLRGNSTLGLLGPMPTTEMPNRAIALAPDGKQYTFAYRVVDLDDLVTSNTPSGAVNPAYPTELQPRDRTRAASQVQVDRIVQEFNPTELLHDGGRLDSGPMIVGPDRAVESGNGRSMALRRLAQERPEEYARYVEMLRNNLSEYGLDEAALAGKRAPVLVRERLSDVDRPAFAATANGRVSAGMSPVEQARQAATSLSDEVVGNLTIGDGDTIATALRRADNQDVVRAWVAAMPENDLANILDESGGISSKGYQQLADTLLVRTYGEGAGVRAFIEAADPDVRNVQTAVMASLPDMAQAEALIRSGQRAADLSLAGDVAAATEVLARLRREGTKVGDYVRQIAMGDRELTPFQEQMLQFLDQNQRRPGAIREALREYAAAVENAADPNQMDMFGGAVASVKKEDAWTSATAGIRREREARVAQQRAKLQAENAARTPAADIVPRTGGPEGTLAVQGAPEPPRPTPRPGAPMEAPRTGGPEGRLEVEGAPPEPANLAPVGDLSTGGPAGTLQQQVIPPMEGSTRTVLRQMSDDVRTWMQRAREMPNQAGLRDEIDSRLAAMENYSTRGQQEAARLRQAFDADQSEDAFRFMSGVEQRNADGAASTAKTEARELEAARMRGIAAQIDEVLKNPTAPGSVERLQNLYADLTEISQAGFTRSSEIRKRLQRQGLLRAGLASKTEDVDGLVRAISRTDPNKPEELRAVLQIISKPRLIDKIMEYQYVNMLSSPITQAVNISSNALQVAGRLLLQNPLEHVFTGGQSSGAGAAFKGTLQGAREALPEVAQIMRTGVSSKSIERAAELGDYGHINRELLTEKFGKTGELMHLISSRPLQAMDALFGHMAYAGAAEQYAQRTADRLLKSGSESVKGMSREQARAHVMANIWDYPEVIEKAGNISDYTLLKSNDSKGTGWGNRAERWLRNGAALTRAEHSDTPVGQTMAFLSNQIMPFFNVPLNSAKQGVDRSLGALYNPIRAVGAARATAAAEKAGDAAGAYASRERFGELAAKSTIAASALTVGAVLATGDNLTGDGPSNASDRAVWEQTHKRNSWRVPGTDTWFSWEGTPMAVPFGMVAGATEGWKESREASAKKGVSDTGDAIGAAGLKTLQGGFSGFASQSFVRALGQQYQLMTGDQTGLGTVAASLTGTASRFMPSSSMVNFLARVTDDMERDAGKPQAASDLPENIGARLATRIPGLRQQVDPKLDMYGEPTPNEQGGAAGLMNAIPLPPLPSYRGRGPRAGDAITREVEKAGVGAPSVPDEVTIPRSDGMKVPLQNPRERRIFQQAYGRAYRENLQAADAGRGDLPPKAIENLRSIAREAAVSAVLAAIGPDEIERRLTAGVR